MGFLSKLFSTDKKKDSEVHLSAIDYEMEALERELREYETTKPVQAGTPPPGRPGQPQQPPPGQQPPMQQQPQPQQQEPPPVDIKLPDEPEPAPTPVAQPTDLTVEGTEAPADEEVKIAETKDDVGVFSPGGDEVKVVDLASETKIVNIEDDTHLTTDFEEGAEQNLSAAPSEEEVQAAQDALAGGEEATEEVQEEAPTEEVAEEAPVEETPAEESAPEETVAEEEAPAEEVAEEAAPEETVAEEETPAEEAPAAKEPETQAELEAQPEAETHVEETPAEAPAAEAPAAAETPPASDLPPPVQKLDKILRVLEKKIAAKAEAGEDVTEASAKMAEARQHFDSKKYQSAKKLAVEIKGKVV